MSHPCISAHLCARMSVCACVCMNNEIEPFLGFFLPHYVHMTYILTHFFSFSSCGTMFSLFLYASDVAKRGACNLHIKSQSSIFTYVQGYAAESDWATILY